MLIIQKIANTKEHCKVFLKKHLFGWLNNHIIKLDCLDVLVMETKITVNMNLQFSIF